MTFCNVVLQMQMIMQITFGSDTSLLEGTRTHHGFVKVCELLTQLKLFLFCIFIKFYLISVVDTFSLVERQILSELAATQ